MTLTAASPPLAKPVLPPLTAEQARDAAAVEALVDRAFGPGRYAKTAERLREGREPLRELSFTARVGGEMVGCVRQWRILIGGKPAVFLGPFAVDAAWRSRGLGAALIHRALDAAREAGERCVLLVGDASYFEPLGFTMVERGAITLPGPVDPRRLLICPLNSDAAPRLAGPVTVG
jgi:predicted N-acetyltransferase YhbS